MQLALAGRALTSAAIAWEIYSRQPFTIFAATYIASNFFGQLFEPSSQAFVSDITTGRVRVEGFGLVRMGINGGWALGLGLASVVTRAYAPAFAITAGVFTFSFLLFTFALREPAHTSSGRMTAGDLRGIIHNRPFRLLCFSSLLIGVVASQLVPSTSIYVTTHALLPEGWVPRIIAVNGLLVVLLQLPASRWMGRVGLRRALILGSLCYAVGYGSFAYGSQVWHFALCIAIVTVGEVLVMPGAIALASELAPDTQRGRYLGVYGLAMMVGWSFGPALGGVLLDARPGRSGVPWFPIAALALLAAVGYASLKKPKTAAAPSLTFPA